MADLRQERIQGRRQPCRCPELNVIGNVWRIMRDNRLANRICRDHDDIVDRCCHGWNRLIDQPWRIPCISRRDRAHRP